MNQKKKKYKMNGIKENLKMLGASLSLRAKRNEVLASNIANAATPNYKARDIDFDTEIKKYQKDGPIKVTNDQHISIKKPVKDLSSVKAIYKNLRSSPRKVNEILRSIRGKKADIALRDLQFSEKRISKEISKTIKSAVSNAENNNQLDIDNLFIKEAYVGKGIVMKRYRPRARGRAGEIKKPFANLTIIVSEKKQTTGSKEV